MSATEDDASSSASAAKRRSTSAKKRLIDDLVKKTSRKKTLAEPTEITSSEIQLKRQPSPTPIDLSESSALLEATHDDGADCVDDDGDDDIEADAPAPISDKPLLSDYSKLIVDEDFLRLHMDTNFTLTTQDAYSKMAGKSATDTNFQHTFQYFIQPIQSTSSASSSSSFFDSASFSQKYRVTSVFRGSSGEDLSIERREFGPHAFLLNESKANPMMIWRHRQLEEIYAHQPASTVMRLYSAVHPSETIYREDRIVILIVAPYISIARIILERLVSSDIFKTSVRSYLVKQPGSWSSAEISELY